MGILSNDRAMCEAIIAMWRDVGVNARVEIIEASVRAQKRRDKSYKGLWLTDPTSTLSDPDGMMWRLPGPERDPGLLAPPALRRTGERRAVQHRREVPRQAYREMTQIFQEHWLWIPIIQPIESYGLQRYVEWKPSPNQQFEVRSFAFRFRRP